MKLRLLLTAFLAAAATTSHAAIVFSGGTGPADPVILTLTTNLVIPITSNGLTGGFLGFAVENAFSAPRDNFFASPTTVHGTPGSITGSYTPPVGMTVPTTDYNVWGSYGFTAGGLNPYNFAAFFAVGPFEHEAGGTFTINAGSVILNPDFVIPDLQSNTIYLLNGNGEKISASVVIPEPSSALLGALGGFVLLRRRRA